MIEQKFEARVEIDRVLDMVKTFHQTPHELSLNLELYQKVVSSLMLLADRLE